MIRLLLLLFFITGASYNFSQYCLTSGPTSTIDSNLESLTLIGDAGAIFYTGCPGLLGTEEYLAQTVFIGAGNSYTLNLQFGTCGSPYNGVGEAWIDFNGDQVFSPSESIGTWMGIPPSAASVFNFTVPSGAITGQSRMRVVHREGGTLPIDPCASFTWGSTTDFSVFIQNGVDCSGYIGDTFDDPRSFLSLPFSESHSTSICYLNQNLVYNSPDVFYLIQGANNYSSIEVSLCGSSFDTFLTVTDANGNVLAINDDHPSCGTQSKLTVNSANHDSLYVIVEGWNNGNGDYTININPQFAGLTEIDAFDFSIAPNPTNNYFEIITESSGELIILAMDGKILHKQLVDNKSKIDVRNFQAGAYMVKLTTSQSIYQHKLLIAK